MDSVLVGLATWLLAIGVFILTYGLYRMCEGFVKRCNAPPPPPPRPQYVPPDPAKFLRDKEAAIRSKYAGKLLRIENLDIDDDTKTALKNKLTEDLIDEIVRLD